MWQGDSLDGDLCVIWPEPTHTNVPVNSLRPQIDVAPAPVPQSDTSVPSTSSGGQSQVRPPHHLAEKQLEAEPEAVRRSHRSTAGRHTNIHHLPQAVGSRAIGAVNSQVPVSNVFRPWQ